MTENEKVVKYDVLQCQKLTVKDLKEHLSGPVISIAVHIIAISIFSSVIIFEPEIERDEIEVTLKEIEMKEIPPPQLEEPEELEPEEIQHEPEIEREEIVRDEVVEPPLVEIDVMDEVVDIDLSNIMLENNSMLKISGLRSTSSVLPASMGYSSGATGDLRGRLYDLKRTKNGTSRKVNYAADVLSIINSGFDKNTLSNFKEIGKILYLSHLFIPSTPSHIAPKQFGVENTMAANYFVAHYRGFISAPTTSSFRFAGEADSIVIVLLDGKVVFEACRGFNVTSWRPKEVNSAHKSFSGQSLVYGDWLKMKKGGSHRIDILFGERHGGNMNAVLLIQDAKTDYERVSSGRPILPVFALQDLNVQERKRLKQVSNWKFSEKIPNFGITNQISRNQPQSAMKKRNKRSGLDDAASVGITF